MESAFVGDVFVFSEEDGDTFRARFGFNMIELPSNGSVVDCHSESFGNFAPERFERSHKLTICRAAAADGNELNDDCHAVCKWYVFRARSLFPTFVELDFAGHGTQRKKSQS
ncbi:MAG: hypothetical protein ACOYD4_04065 [Solirubrobacterales bacterium]